MTGSGKSTVSSKSRDYRRALIINQFISTTIGKDIGIGYGLSSVTQEIHEFSLQYRGREIVMIDTPGFDGSKSEDIDDEKILKQIGNWMEKRFVIGCKL
jgi:predicted GTPase